MGIFIALLLVSSWIQSMWKLTFYPRLLRLAVLGGLSLFIIFASERLSGYNLHDIAVLLESKERLDTLCALVVMQEFVALFFGLTLLHAVELGERALTRGWYERIFGKDNEYHRCGLPGRARGRPHGGRQYEKVCERHRRFDRFRGDTRAYTRRS